MHHHTYRFSRRADSEGLIVIDDPESIIRCTNKVFLAEVFRRHRIPCPRTWIANNQNAEEIAAEAGFPCVVKRPDSSFSKGVEKANDERELRALLDTFLRDSELAVVQEFVPSSFDWRIGVLGGAPLYACRYYMARGQWKIQVSSESGRRLYGHADTLPVSEAPRRAVSVARRAARLMGNGFYGVDIKQVGRRFLVMEVNDNPSVDAGCEDLVLGDALYDAVMAEFLRRLEARGGRRP